MPKYKFKWSNLPPSLLDALCRELLDVDGHEYDPAAALQEAYGARPDEEFIREAWPVLLRSWLPTASEARERIVQALQEVHHEKALVKGRGAQLAYLRGLRNAKRLREIVWGELVAAGEVERTGERDWHEEAGKERGQSHVERLAKTAKTQASRKPSAVSSSDGAKEGAKTRDGRPPRQKKPEVEKSLEATLWEAADRLRSRVDAAEYKHVVLGLIFLKYVSDVFTKRREELERLVDDPDSDYFMPTDEAKQSVLEDRDEYAAEGVFWVPEGHRWDDLRKAAKQTDIGERIDSAMDAIEKENPEPARGAAEAVRAPRAHPGHARRPDRHLLPQGPRRRGAQRPGRARPGL